MTSPEGGRERTEPRDAPPPPPGRGRPTPVAVATGREAAVRAAGLRVTGARLAALGVLEEQPHADADDVARGVRARIGRVSTQAVYDVLRALTDAGLVRRIEPAGSPALFELRVGDNHHHLVCRRCGVVRDVDCATGSAPCLAPVPLQGEDTGFRVDEAEVIYWGTCAGCVQASSR